MTQSVCVVDDDQAMCDSVQRLIATLGLQVQGFASAEDYLACCPPGTVSCLILDMHMPGMGGMALLERISNETPPPAVVVVSGRADIRLAVRALKTGALEFLEKPYAGDELLECVQRALRHNEAIRREHDREEAIARRIGQLTPREYEVASHYAQGLSSKKIAQALNLSPATVRNHLAAIYDKLRVSDKAALAILLGAALGQET